jgi:transposase-like protein
MPDKTSCPHCGVVGYVRRERIFRGETAVSQYACGSCMSSWTVSDGGERREGPVERRHVPRGDRRKSSLDAC